MVEQPEVGPEGNAHGDWSWGEQAPQAGCEEQQRVGNTAKKVPGKEGSGHAAWSGSAEV